MPLKRIKELYSALKGSLAAKQLFYILVFSSLITFFSTSFTLFLEFKKDRHGVDDQFELIKAGHLESLSGSLWQLDDLQVKTHLNDILNMRDLIFLEIREGGEVLYSAGRLTEGERWVKKGFDMFYTHGGQERNIGVLDVYASLEGVYNRLFERLLVILVTQALKTFLASMFILAVLHRLVTRHIMAIARYAKEMKPDALGFSLELPNRPSSPKHPDEIDQLVVAINEMRHRLCQDILRRQAVEYELARNRSLLDETQKLTKIGGWEYHVAQKQFRWTNQLYEMYGVEVDPAMDHLSVALSCFGETDKPLIMDAFERCIKEGRAFSLDFEITSRRGEAKWIRSTGRPVLEGEKVVRVLGNMMEITETVRAEEAQKRFLKTLMTVLDSMDAIICVSEMETFKLLFMNKTMIERFGEGLTGQEYYALFMDGRENGRLSRVPLLISAADTTTGSMVWESRSPDGFCYINYERSIQWVDGRQVRFHHATDITQIKKLEDELRQSHKMEAIGTLAGGIAHDFNNILASVLGYAELAIDEAPAGTSLEGNLKEVVMAGTRAVELVRQILTFARQSDGEVKPIRVKPIVIEALKLIRSSIPTTITITQEIESDSLAMGNATQMHQILMNLCTNAAYAMEEGGGVLNVKLFDTVLGYGGTQLPASLRPGNYLTLRVADTGSGIPPAVMPSIFEPFFTTKGPGEGTGMGLAMVHGIVKQYGGEIKVEHNEPEGTVFTIYLPVTEEVPVIPALPPAERPLPTGRERILVVDDEPSIAKMMGTILERLGYNAVIRMSSEEALALFKSGPEHFDLVITDMTMPNMTGDLLTQQMRGIRPDIPVILCTGYSRKVTDESMEKVGVKNFMIKPIVKKELAEIVRKVLDEAAESGGTMAETQGVEIPEGDLLG